MSTASTQKTAALNDRIDKLNSRANGIMEEYQEVGLACLQHLKDHGDIGPCNRLYNGMPKGARKLAMGVWMVKHGSLKPNQDKGTKDTSPMAFAKDRPTSIEGAMAKKWYDEIPERNISDVVDLQVMIKQLIQRCQGKKIKIGGEEKPHEAHSILKMLAVGVGLPNPYAEEEAAMAAKEAADKASATAKDAVQAATPAAPVKGAAKTAADKPSTAKEPKAVAKGKPAKKGRATAKA